MWKQERKQAILRKSAERDARLETLRPVKRTMPTCTFGGELENHVVKVTVNSAARCYASTVYAMALCVCLSVTNWYHVQTAKQVITQITPHNSPVTLVF